MAAYNRNRDEYSRFYGTAFWRKRSAAFLAAHPICERCGAPATQADHEPERRVLIAQGVADPDADEFLHPLCARDHASKTRRQTNARRRRK